jgi:hypothetical protein
MNHIFRLVLPAVMLTITACTPTYTSTRELMPTGGTVEITGIAVSKFSGDLSLEIQNELVVALRASGYKLVIDARVLAPQGVEVKVEGDTVTQRTADPRPSKIEKGEARVIELRTGRTLMRYNFAAGNAAEVRSPADFARDLARLISRDFVPRK